MISNLLKMLSYPFMQRALVVGILVSLCAALLGVSLVLKRYSMIGDGPLNTAVPTSARTKAKMRSMLRDSVMLVCVCWTTAVDMRVKTLRRSVNKKSGSIVRLVARSSYFISFPSI